MCFRHLPITFDDTGKAHLAEGGWSAAREPRSPPVPPAAPERTLTDWQVAPVTRIAGAMDFHATVDLAGRRVVDAHASAAAFRGYEVVLLGRDPRDAMELSSRACGVCGGVHASTSSMALDMALPVTPPPLGILARNIAQAAEFLYDHPLHLCLLAGPDYSERAVRRTDPGLWEAAQRSAAPGAGVHGRATIGDLMTALNPLTGSLYLEAFARTRVAMGIVKAMVGDYPHPATLVPGGISVTLDPGAFRGVLASLDELVDYVKVLIHVYGDLMEFLRRERPQYEKVGEHEANLLCVGRYDEVDSYDGRAATLDTWGGRRAIPPAVVVGGELRTTSLRAINLGFEEFVDHSFYDQWSGHRWPEDPQGGPLSPFHPWNKQTLPRPEGRNWKERYTWATAPRWDREVLEAGPLARNWALAAAGRAWDDVLEPTGKAVRFVLPRGGSLPEMHFEWRLPERVNAIERNLARVYSIGMTWLQCRRDTEKGLVLLGRGERKVWNRSTIPRQGIGVGFWEAARGALAHWVEVDDHVIRNYQIITPSSFNASPRDPWGRPGPYEQAAINTPIVEDFSADRPFTGIDILRAIRSFDPCMPCAVHLDTGSGIVTRDVTSCACGDEEP